MDPAQERGWSERAAQRYRPTPRENEDALTRATLDLASQYGRYVYRRIMALLRDEGWRVSEDRVECAPTPAGVRRARSAPVAGPHGRADAVHRARLASENGSCESFNSKLRDEFLNGEIFYSMKELRLLVERWRIHSNTVRPHSSLGYRPPAPQVWPASSLGHKEAGIASLIPPLHTSHGNYRNSKIVALH